MRRDRIEILLIEDEPTLADVTAFRLELLGFDVRLKATPAETLAALDERLPDVILLDLGLDGGEGLDLLGRLSTDQRTGKIPVLVFSTSADLNDVQRAYNAGADEFLVTPYDPTNLERKIEKLLVQPAAK